MSDRIRGDGGRSGPLCDICEDTGRTVCPVCYGTGEFRGGMLPHLSCPRCGGGQFVECAPCPYLRILEIEGQAVRLTLVVKRHANPTDMVHRFGYHVYFEDYHPHISGNDPDEVDMAINDLLAGLWDDRKPLARHPELLAVDDEFPGRAL
jgi:hypothetical protein